MHFDIPRGEVFRVDEVDVRLSATPHPFIAGRQEEIEANWLEEKRARPALFDGEVALLASLKLTGSRLEGTAHVVRYSAFLYWRGLRPVSSAEHCYAHAMPVSSEGALVAIRMSGHTVSAGLAYFASGSFEPTDFAGGRVDIGANMLREVREETGLNLDGLPTDRCFHALSLPQGTVIFRRVFMNEPANAIADRIRRFVSDKGDPEGEIAGPVVIRDPADLPDRLAPQMPALIDWHFRTARSTYS
ncbi:MAG: NUDIX hydrolase [Rhizobiaceae bacterium]|nr:NUDIX hydrolase [Rhizobiaceae bacterium]MCV0406280.1 NUDIX hydrolase [Rhizobiaceae bacterium]